MKLQPRFSETFLSEKIEAEKERLGLLHQKTFEVSSDLFFFSENTQMIPFTANRVPPQQIARSEIPNPTPFTFHVIAE